MLPKPSPRKRIAFLYYEVMFENNTDPVDVGELIYEAARKPKKKLPDEDFERLFWMAQDMMKGADI